MMKVEPCRTRAEEFCRALCSLLALIFFTVSAPKLAAAQQNPTETETFVQVELGQALGFIEIPKISLDLVFVAGVGKQELKLGPGHYPGTPLPGQFGNAAIAGHRTTYGAPFSNLDLLNTGDKIVVSYPSATYVYLVSSTTIVTPDDVSVIATKDSSRGVLTLTTCHPKGSAAQRLIITAELDPKQSSPLGPATYYNGSSSSNDSTAPVLQATPAAGNTSANSSAPVSTPNSSNTQSTQSTAPAAQETDANDQVVRSPSSGAPSLGVQLVVHEPDEPTTAPVEKTDSSLNADQTQTAADILIFGNSSEETTGESTLNVVLPSEDLPSGIVGIVWVVAIGVSVMFGAALQRLFIIRSLAWAFALLPITFAIRGFTQFIEASL